MEWNELSNLILNSIQIIGIFIAIIIGLIISKVIELKKEKSEIEETIEDINNELVNMQEQFNKLKEDNYNFYKQDNIYEIIDLIFEDREFVADDSIPYVTEKEQNELYCFIKDYMLKVADIAADGNNADSCKKILKIKKYSIEDTIIDELYERSE